MTTTTMNHLVPYLLFLQLLTIPLSVVHTFTPSSLRPLRPFLHHPTSATFTTSTTELHMVFDFFQKRTAEGVEQIQKLSESIAAGELSKGLTDAAAYTSQTNAAFADGLARSRNRLLYDLEGWNGDILEELMDVLLRADIGMDISESVIEEVRTLREGSTEIIGKGEVRGILRGKLLESLDAAGPHTANSTDDGTAGGEDEFNQAAIRFSEDESIPTVIFVMGANGMGKTTTIGKLASRLATEGSQKVLLAACDTFRAGAVDQLEMWANRADVACYGPNEQQKSPSAVLYGALDMAMAAPADGSGGLAYDTVIVDTSGRLSNNDALTEELVKMKRVIQKRLSVSSTADQITGKKTAVPNADTPHETLLVIDAAQGRMALDSAKAWNEALGGISGLVLTKLDGSAKGGSVVAVSRELGLPIKLIGVGEKIDDLRDFEAEKFVDSLLGIGSAGGNTSSSSTKEDKAMEARLKKLGKDRDERNTKQEADAKKASKTDKASTGGGGNFGLPSLGGGGGGEVMDGMTFEPMDTPGDDVVNPVTPGVTLVGGDGGGASNKNKNKKKKKKKKKRK